MALNAGKMSFVVSASAGQLFAGLNQASAAVRSFGSVAGQVAASVGAAFGGLSAVGVGQWALGLAANLQKTQQQFGILIGNSQQAASVLSQLREFDIVSPLGLQTLLDASRTLLGFGMSASQVVPVVKMLGDVSMGNQERFAGLALAMGQVSAAGRMTGQDLLQFINAGFNPLQEVAKRTGETLTQVKDRMSEGGVSADEIRQALVDATSAGGRFAGMIEAAGQTVAGRFEMLKGRVELLATSLGESMLPAASSVVGVMESLVDMVGSFDGRAVKAAAQVIAFAGTFALVIRYSGTVVAAFRSIVTAIQAMTTAQAIFQAFSGPKGWAQLAIAAVAAAGAVVAVETAFSGVADQATKATQQSQQAIQATTEAAKQAANATKAATAGAIDYAAKLTEAGKKWDGVIDGVARHNELLQRGQQVAEQYQGPEATFGQTAKELQELLGAGAITGETFSAAIGDAGTKLLEARLEAAGLNQEIQGVGAAAANTMEGFRAMADARRGMERDQARAAEAASVQQQIAAMTAGAPRTADTEFSKEMRDLLKSQRDILQDLLQETKSKETFKVGTVELY
jgi:tape measure domain-containing protein